MRRVSKLLTGKETGFLRMLHNRNNRSIRSHDGLGWLEKISESSQKDKKTD